MDIMQEFEKYLPKWCEEHHRPLPPTGKINKIVFTLNPTEHFDDTTYWTETR